MKEQDLLSKGGASTHVNSTVVTMTPVTYKGPGNAVPAVPSGVAPRSVTDKSRPITGGMMHSVINLL